MNVAQRAAIVSRPWYARKLPCGAKLVHVGDSLVANADSSSGSGVSVSHGARSEMDWARWLDLNGPRVRYDIWNDVSSSPNFWKGANQGIGGQDELDTFARRATTLALKPDAVVLTIGTNGVNAGRTAAAIFATIQAEVQFYLANRVRVWLGLVRPRGTFEVWGGSMWVAADAKWAVLTALNALLISFARATPGVTLWDTYSPLDDGTGHAVVANSIDGLHSTPIGAYLPAVGLSAIIQAQVQAGRYFDSDGGGPNLITSAPFNSSGGQVGTGFSGAGVPTGWRWARSAGTTTGVCTVEADPDGGQKSVATLTPSGVVGQETVIFQPIDAGGGLGSGYIANALVNTHWYRGRCFVEANNYPFREISLGVRAKVSNFLATGNLPNDKTTDKGNYPFVAGGYYLETPPFMAGAAETGFNPNLKITLQGDVAGTPVVKTSRWSFQECADPRPLYGF